MKVRLACCTLRTTLTTVLLHITRLYVCMSVTIRISASAWHRPRPRDLLSWDDARCDRRVTPLDQPASPLRGYSPAWTPRKAPPVGGNGLRARSGGSASRFRRHHPLPPHPYPHPQAPRSGGPAARASGAPLAVCIVGGPRQPSPPTPPPPLPRGGSTLACLLPDPNRTLDVEGAAIHWFRPRCPMNSVHTTCLFRLTELPPEGGPRAPAGAPPRGLPIGRARWPTRLWAVRAEALLALRTLHPTKPPVSTPPLSLFSPSLRAPPTLPRRPLAPYPHPDLAVTHVPPLVPSASPFRLPLNGSGSRG